MLVIQHLAQGGCLPDHFRFLGLSQVVVTLVILKPLLQAVTHSGSQVEWFESYRTGRVAGDGYAR